MQQATQTLEVKSDNRINEAVVNKISADEFFEKYKPIQNPDLTSDNDGFWLKNCMFNISDKKYVHEIFQVNPSRVWTVHHSDTGDIEWIESGFNYTNRNGFIITEAPYDGDGTLMAHEDYRILKGKIVINLKDKDAVDKNAFCEPLIEALDDAKFDMGLFLNVKTDFNSVKGFVIFALSVIECEEDPCPSVFIKTVRAVMDAYMAENPEIASYGVEVEVKASPYF